MMTKLPRRTVVARCGSENFTRRGSQKSIWRGFGNFPWGFCGREWGGFGLVWGIQCLIFKNWLYLFLNFLEGFHVPLMASYYMGLRNKSEITQTFTCILMFEFSWLYPTIKTLFLFSLYIRMIHYKNSM